MSLRSGVLPPEAISRFGEEIASLAGTLTRNDMEMI
jgi:hypothetical protein